MHDSGASPPSPSQGRHLLLFDGVCGLCDGFTQFVLAQDRRALFDFAPLQSESGRAMVARCGGNPDELTSLYVVANYRGSDARVFVKSRAVTFVAGELGWPWRLARLSAIVPRRLLDFAYDAVASCRYRLFGRYEQCTMPRPEWRHRFIE